MQSSDMKNMVVLKNIPSNMVDEAIIIFKQSQKVKTPKFLDKNNKEDFAENQTKSKDYILKEAEMLVTDYINKLEDKAEKSSKNIREKYRNLKYYSIISTTLLIISLIINFI